ncbi:hypothetical protein FXO38_11728 [Capsicum annuum]|nr:hypothetical protein FXO38_11728 [Capsicum annuum]
MESGLTFSLGLIQIQSTSNEIDISGFVLERSDNHEKLRDAASVKGKKTVVAISKENRKEVVKRDPLPKGMKYVIKTVPHHPLRFDISFNRNFVTDVEYFVDQEKIKGHPSVEEVNKSPSGTSNTIADPINEEAPHEPSLMISVNEHHQQNKTYQLSKVGVIPHKKLSGGTYHEQVLMKVDMNAIESLVKKYVDKRFDDIKAIMKKYHEEMKKTHEEMMLAVKEKHDAPQKVVIKIDSSNKDVEKNETHGDDLGTPKEYPKDVSEKESETEVKNVAIQHSIDNTIANFSSPVSAIQCMELLQKENLPDLILPINNIEDRNELQVSCTVISSEVFQEFIDNIIDDMSTPIIVMLVNSDDLSQKVNLPDPFLQTGNVEDPNELRDAIKTRAPRNRKRTTIFRSSFTTKFGSSCKGKEFATVDLPRKHPFDGYLIFHDMPTGLIEEYFDWIVEGLLKFHKKKKLKDNHYKANKLGIGFSSLDFVVAQPDSKNWFYTMSPPNTCWNDEHVDDIFYYLRKKSKQQKDQARYTAVNCLFNTYIDATYKCYFEDAAGDSLSTQDDYTKIGLLKNTKRTVWSSLEAYTDKMSKVTGDLNDTPFDVEHVEDIAQQDCGVFVAAYAEFLSDQMQIPSSNLDAEYLRKRYATLLWNDGVKKAKKIYSSDHDDPPRPRPFYVPRTDKSNILAIE